MLATVAVVAAGAGCASGGEDRLDVRSQVRKTFGPQDVADYQHRYDEHLTTCMRAAGFRHVAFRPKSKRERLGLTEREFAERYGFGISTLVDHPAAAPQADPNAAIRSALPADGQARYDDRLQDCLVKTNDALGPAPNVVLVPDGKDDGYLDVSGEAEADRRVVEAKRAYAACMATSGFTADSGEAVQAEISRRAAPFVRAHRQAQERRRAQGTNPWGLRIDDTMDRGQVAVLRQLQRYEIRAAAADEVCGRRLYPVVADVHAEYLRRYLDGG